jgi:hypothetical protein
MLFFVLCLFFFYLTFGFTLHISILTAIRDVRLQQSLEMTLNRKMKPCFCLFVCLFVCLFGFVLPDFWFYITFFHINWHSCYYTSTIFTRRMIRGNY